MKHDIRNRHNQRGAVLAVGLILLAVATLVTLTAMNTGVMQESMTANQDNNARSFMAAEAGGAELVEWINKQLAAHGKITEEPTDILSGDVGGDSSITYVMELYDTESSWTSLPLKVVIEGRALAADNETVLARTELLVEWGEPPPPGPNPPAAISCFHGPCSINAGAGQGSDEGYGTVSGFNHQNTPSLDCNGAACRVPPSDMTGPVVPAVYLGAGGSVGLQGGNHNAYQGLDPENPEETKVGNDDEVAWTPDTYTDNERDIPEWNEIFDGVDLTPTDLTGIGGNEAEVFNDAPLVIDGTDFEMKGTSLFIGVIVIRNCGSITMAGNPNVYGAIIIDAVRRDADGEVLEGSAGECGENYDPFAGAGTPAVRFVGGPGDGGSGKGKAGSNITIWSELL